jgi:hypothetical protein
MGFKRDGRRNGVYVGILKTSEEVYGVRVEVYLFAEIHTGSNSILMPVSLRVKKCTTYSV